ncbi:uncharacterized protein LOC125944205 [Dermacentor silvarum]|uniref:uncharacterized protein LOC125944205 n=1 Tax=Dermacentor silvarum TaxID=543639 RepID=UPI0021018258|nr:uncharacterized protein LOC125944205 [Dermacentor silvarum]
MLDEGLSKQVARFEAANYPRHIIISVAESLHRRRKSTRAAEKGAALAVGGGVPEAAPGQGRPPDRELKTAVGFRTRATRTSPGRGLLPTRSWAPPLHPFENCCLRPASVCARGQDESCRATGPSSTTSCPARTPPPSTPAAKPPAFPGIATLPDNLLLLPEAGRQASVPVGRTRAVGLRARAPRPAARPERRRRQPLLPSRLPSRESPPCPIIYYCCPRPVSVCVRGQNLSCRATSPSATISCPTRTPPPSARAAEPPVFSLRARASTLW